MDPTSRIDHSSPLSQAGVSPAMPSAVDTSLLFSQPPEMPRDPAHGAASTGDENTAAASAEDDQPPHFSGSGETGNDVHWGVEDLFGDLFEVGGEQRPVDPALLDTRNILLRLFGEHVHEKDVDFEDERQAKLAKEMADNKAAARFAVAEKLFGDAGAAALQGERIESFGCLQSSLPDVPDLGQHEELWLTDMPKVAPNRQTLHMEPQPFFPSRCVPLNSTERMLYTTQNVVRWAHHKGTNTFMSNARVIRWSDGSVTLHVGSDLFTLQPSKENALAMLSRPVVLRKGEAEVPAMMSVLNSKKHFLVDGSTAVSIEEAVIAENARFRSRSTKHHLAYATSTLPNINWMKMSTTRSPIEEYVLKEYNRRQKLIEQRKKEGRPMTLTEQMEMENELFQRLDTLRAEELLEQQEEAQREAALRATASPKSSRRSRLDRNTNLEEGEHMVVGNNRMGGGEGNYEENDDVDFDTLFEEMQRKRQREDAVDNAERMRRVYQREDAQITLYEPLMKALRNLLSLLPEESNALGSVRETLDFLGTGKFSAGVIAKEVPLMIEEVASECPDVDLSAVRYELLKIFP